MSLGYPNDHNPNQDPMSYKAAKVACQLVESTERFLATVGEIQKSIDSIGNNNAVDYIKRVIQQYEHVCMIVNVLQSITAIVGNPQGQSSLSTAAMSASTTSATALSRVYTLLKNSLEINDTSVKENLEDLGLLVQQHKLANIKVEEDDKAVALQAMDMIPTKSPQPSQQNITIDYERRELALKRKKFEEEREEFEQERKRLFRDRENVLKIQRKLEEQNKIEQSKLEQQKWEQQQQRQKWEQQQQQQKLEQQQEEQEKRRLAKQNQQFHLLSTKQYLEQFEKTAKTFAQSINMNIDNVWESMLLHALPKDKLAWAEEALFGKKHPWAYAKRLYSLKYAENPSVSLTDNEASWKVKVKDNAINASLSATNMATTAKEKAAVNLPITPTAAFAATNAIANATTSVATAAPVAMPNSTFAVASLPAPKTTTASQPSVHNIKPLQPVEQDQRRVADYCQHLLSLEMKFYDTIEEYNKRYMRYCLIANMDTTGRSFVDRYIRSLYPKYRDIVRAYIRQHHIPLENINQVMTVAENVINAYLAKNPARSTAPYSQKCIHNRNSNQAT